MQNVPSLNSITPSMSSIELVDFINSERQYDDAELRHDHFMAKVPKVLGELAAPNFRGTYIDSQNKERPCYHFQKREACLMAMSYSYELQAKVFDRMTGLESKQAYQIPQTFSAALRLAGELQEQVETLTLEAKNNAPKVEFALAVRRMEGACKIGDFGKAIGIGQNKLFARLREDEILMENNLPYQKFIDQELFVVIEQTPYTDRSGKSHPTFTTMVTGKGQVFLSRKYRAEAA